MRIVQKKPEAYGLQKVGKNCHRLVKILKEYENEKEAIEDMTKLLTGEIGEEDLVEGGKERS